MSFIELAVELGRTNTLLEEIAINSKLIAQALTRLSPPLRDSSNPPYKAGIKDLLDNSPSNVESRISESADFALRNETIPGSESFRDRVREYEEQIEKEYGKEARDSLPWNTR